MFCHSNNKFVLEEIRHFSFLVPTFPHCTVLLKKKSKYLRYGSVAVRSWFAPGALEVCSRFALGTLQICESVWFGAIFLDAVCAYTPILCKHACSVLHVAVFLDAFLFMPYTVR